MYPPRVTLCVGAAEDSLRLAAEGLIRQQGADVGPGFQPPVWHAVTHCHACLAIARVADSSLSYSYKQGAESRVTARDRPYRATSSIFRSLAASDVRRR